MSDDKTDLKTMSFEAALAELETIVARLEKGDVPLKSAEEKVEKIRSSADGKTVTTESLD